MGFNARIICDSVGPNGARLTTFETVMPRMVLAEFNTHRMFSRNSASSRAIPVEKMLARVRDDCFLPEYWGKNQKGMQAEEELSADEQHTAAAIWTHASCDAREHSQNLANVGVHKQITNRLLEPFLWHTIIFTCTEISNFIGLRDDSMAAPEIQKPAHMIVEAYEASRPMELKAGEWHLPLVTGYDLRRHEDGHWLFGDVPGKERSIKSQDDWVYLAKICSGRCGRVSYLTHEGKRSLEEDEKMFGRLLGPGHMSPLEHAAEAMTNEQWVVYANRLANDWIVNRVPVGNFWGFKQFRKTVGNEHDFSKIKRTR